MSGKNAGGIAKNQNSRFGVKGWLLILFCMCLFFMGGGSTNDGLNTVIPMFSEMYGWNTGLLYTLNTIGGWVGIIGAILFSFITEKWGAKWAIILSLILEIGVFLFWGHVTTVAGFAVAVMLCTIASNGFMQVGPSNLAATWYPTKKGLVMGWMTMGCNVSTAIYVRIFTAAAVVGGGIAAGFNAYAIFMALLVVLALLFLKDRPEDANYNPDNDASMTPEERDRLLALGEAYKRSSPWTVKKLLKTPVVWIIGVAYGIIIMITMGTASQIIPTIMSFGFSQEFALNMMTIAAIIGIVASWAFGFLDAKIGTRKASLVFYIWTMLAILFMVLPGKWTIYPAIFFMGGFLGAGNNLTASITGTVFGRYDFSKAWSVIFPITIVVRSFGYAIVGVLSDKTGGYTVPYLVLMACAVLAFILIFFMKDQCIGRNYISEDEYQA